MFVESWGAVLLSMAIREGIPIAHRSNQEAEFATLASSMACSRASISLVVKPEATSSIGLTRSSSFCAFAFLPLDTNHRGDSKQAHQRGCLPEVSKVSTYPA